MSIDNNLVPLYNGTTMKWIATNIRFPEDMYMDLKFEAARRRKSVAAVVREKVTKKKVSSPKSAYVKAKMHELEKLARETARQNPGLNLTKALIEMRYEQ